MWKLGMWLFSGMGIVERVGGLSDYLGDFMGDEERRNKR
jgi:hypothetical protein